MKVAINTCYGGFSLREKAWRRMAELGHEEAIKDIIRREEAAASGGYVSRFGIEGRPSYRSDAIMLQVIEEMGPAADGECASISVIEIPDDVEWEVEEYDGREWVAEKHRVWS